MKCIQFVAHVLCVLSGDDMNVTRQVKTWRSLGKLTIWMPRGKLTKPRSSGKLATWMSRGKLTTWRSWGKWMLAGWCFKPSQPQRIISGLKETFVKRYIFERTKKAEIRPEEQSEKAESCWENLLMKYSWKGHKERNRHKNGIKRSWQAQLVYVKSINRNISIKGRWACGDFQSGR